MEPIFLSKKQIEQISRYKNDLKKSMPQPKEDYFKKPIIEDKFKLIKDYLYIA
jgi:hypothetical protein